LGSADDIASPSLLVSQNQIENKFEEIKEVNPTLEKSIDKMIT
jgi:hypothetical protein